MAFGDIWNATIGWSTFAFFFIIMFNGHYFANLPGLFQYWEYDNGVIRFNNMNKLGNRLFMMIFPNFAKLEQINTSDIKSAQVIGSTGEIKSLDFMVPVSNAYSIFYARMSMIKNPLEIQLTLNDGRKIDLDASRDYTYHSKETIQRLNQFMNDLDISVRKTEPLH